MEKTKKKKVFVIIAVIVVIIAVVAAAFALYAGSKKTAAEDAALKHAGVTHQEAAMLKSEIDFSGLSMICDVSFKTSDCDYDYEISVSDLTVIDFEKEYYGTSGSQTAQGTAGGDAVQQNGQTPGTDVTVSEAAAKEAVLSHAGLTESDLQFYRSQIDRDQGMSKYEIEFSAGGYEYDYEVDCTSGEILKFEKEKLNG